MIATRGAMKMPGHIVAGSGDFAFKNAEDALFKLGTLLG
jgi:hypothetical protein